MIHSIVSLTVRMAASRKEELGEKKGGVDAGHHAHDGKPERARSVFAAGAANVFVKDVERCHVV